MNSYKFSRTDQTIIHTNSCMHCRQSNAISLDIDPYTRWTQGRNIQDVFPHLSSDDRELIVSGTHPKCWDQIFPAEMED